MTASRSTNSPTRRESSPRRRSTGADEEASPATRTSASPVLRNATRRTFVSPSVEVHDDGVGHEEPPLGRILSECSKRSKLPGEHRDIRLEHVEAANGRAFGDGYAETQHLCLMGPASLLKQVSATRQQSSTRRTASASTRTRQDFQTSIPARVMAGGCSTSDRKSCERIVAEYTKGW